MFSYFDDIIIRTPYFPMSQLDDTPLENIFDNATFKEAIYLASPVLYHEFQKSFVNKKFDKKTKQKIIASLYRYLTRMSYRCTPFGLFAGVFVGTVGDHTNIEIEKYKRKTRFDMLFLSNLIFTLTKEQTIKEKSKYYLNTSIYKVGNQYRYIEFLDPQIREKYQVTSIQDCSHLKAIIKAAQNGAFFKDLLGILENREIDKDIACNYINDLINSQFLVNELSLSITGSDYFTKILNILNKMQCNHRLENVLKNIQNKINGLDSCTNDLENIHSYTDIIKLIKDSNIPVNEQYLFQVDIHGISKNMIIENKIMKQILEAMRFLNKIGLKYTNYRLDSFKKEFYNRYENREIPLMEVLDPEIGIGYPSLNVLNRTSPLLAGINISSYSKIADNTITNNWESLLLTKIVDAHKNNEIEILLTENDINENNNDWDNLPPTLYSIFNCTKNISGEYVVHLRGFYGPTGAKILSRFAHLDIKIKNIIDNIISKEDKLYPNAIIAEIAHLQEPRIGNISYRPHIRSYEIPILVLSDLKKNNIINTSDILVSLKNNEFFLRTKKSRKRIIPRLTNTHNYSNSTISVYRFLSDIQEQYRTGIYFDWGNIGKNLKFLPRVRFKNIIFSLATWNINIQSIRPIFNLKGDLLLKQIRIWRAKEKIPLKTTLSEYDYELLINWESIQSIESFWIIVKNKKEIILKESIYNENKSIVKDIHGNLYANECIAFFHKNN